MTDSEFPLVAIGASAGGLEALQKLVTAIPSESGICYVIVQHLAPDHPSIMDQLLGAHSSIDVRKIEDGMKAEPDTVFVIPAGPALTISNGRFRLHDHRKARGVRTPIDRFFTSVADEIGRNAFCVVLSGTGSDGTEGLRAIKAAGGVAIVQQSDSARFPGMPDSAAATGLVDFVLAPERIPARLIDIVDHRARLNDAGLQERLHDELVARLPDITDLLRDTTEQDFGSYKPGTLVRRIERRMTLLRERTVDGLLKRLSEDESERERLVQDFLIGVTHFFRDSDAFETLLEQAIQPILDADPEKIRVWVPGCSTGEEAYSLAMLFLDEMENRGMRVNLQVFGTDIDGAALMHARQGLYAERALADMPDTMRSKHFVEEDGSYRASAMLRESCIFAPHNLLADPPFSRLDLVSCRNLLIYLNAEGQETILPRFHYGLNPRGFLFLGPSETLGKHDDLFKTVSKKHRIFVRNDATAHRYTTMTKSQSRPSVSSIQGSYRGGAPRKTDTPAVSMETRAEAMFLQHFAAPFAVIDRQNSVVYLSEQMARFVKPTKGAPSAELDSYLARDLRVPIRAVISQARDSGDIAATQNVVVQDGDDRRLIDIQARPMDDGDSIMVVLQETRQPDADVLAAAAEGQDYPGRDMVEHELVSTRQQLESTLVEFESSSQELRSTNEELLSMNEELQSANEELETSREELQSINEELETMNAELNENNDQLRRANSDIKNLFESTEVATLFLDSQKCVRSHTPKTTALFGILDRDAGRPLSELVQRFEHDALIDEIDEVGRTLETHEREVTISKTNQTFILRIRPYRTVDNRIDGYVLTFFDISQRKLSEAALQKNAAEMARQYSELETLYDTTPVGLSLMDRDLRWLRVNARLAEINGFSIEEHIGKKQNELIPDVNAKVEEAQLRVFETGESDLGHEVTGVTPGEPGKERTWIVDYYPVKADGEVFAIGCCVRDVTDERELRAELQRQLKVVEESEAQLARLFDSAPAFIAMHEGPDHLYRYANPALHQTLGNRDLIGKSIAEAVPEIKDAGIIEKFDEVFKTSKPVLQWDFPASVDRGNGLESGHYRQVLQPWFHPDGRVAGVMSFAYDITDRVESEERKSLLMAELQHRVKNTLASIAAITRFVGRSSSSVADMQDRLVSRLNAMSRTHDLLTGQEWRKISIRQLLENELAPYSEIKAGQIDISGANITLTPEEALAVGMAFHELLTNSIKHGALAASDGQVKMSVHAGTKSQPAAFRWLETGNFEKPAADEPQGFGRFLLEKAVATQVNGSSSLEFGPGRVEFTLTFPGKGFDD